MVSMTGRPGISLKLSALVTLLLVVEMLLLSVVLDAGGPGYHGVAIVVFMLGALVAGLLFAAGLDWLITSPLVRMAKDVRKLSREGFRQSFTPRGGDELRELGEALELLRKTAVKQEEELMALNRELEAKVEARSVALRDTQEQLFQVEKLASIGELAAGVAHEVNNPTGVILARASYLCSIADEEGLDPDVIEDLEVMVHQARRIQTVTGDLLTFGRRSGSLEKALLDLVEVCRLTINLLAHKARDEGIRLETDLPDSMMVRGNRDRLEQVVFNLLKNAMQAAGPGGWVKLSLLEPGELDPHLRIIVDDNGPGVPPEQRIRVFDPFFTTMPIGKGAGLGLSLVYGIVTEHGGSVHVEDRPEGGARFVMSLPPGDHDMIDGSQDQESMPPNAT